jgi:general secretion pathway protein G
MRTNKKSGFTLVEILIVVVILGILAAIVIPQFSQASLEAREASLISNLQTVRSQIELYKIQHLEVLPADAATLTTALTTQTDIDGNAWAAGAGTAFGPYMREIPDNPFTTTNVIGDATGAAIDWVYVPVVAQGTYTFVADDGGTSPNGTAHSAL